jgi:phage terminase large subunit
LGAARAAGCPEEQVRLFLRAGYVAQPKQLRFHALARECDAQGGPTAIGFGGARGGGKSHCILAQVAVDDCQRMAGLKVLLLRKVGKAVRESFEDLRGRVLVGLPHRYRRQEGTLEFHNGSRIILGHFQNERDVDNYLGLEYDVIAVEEATMLTSAKYKAIKTTYRTAKGNWRPRMYSSTNPGGVGHAWYKREFVAGTLEHEGAKATKNTEREEHEARGETRFVASTVDDNAFVNPEYKRTLDSLTGWQKRAWRYGDWDIAAGQFFTTWREDAHIRDERLEIRAGDLRRVWGSLDYGFTHYTVAYLLGEDGDGNVFVLDEHAERRWVVERHARAIGEMLERNGLTVGQLDCFVSGADAFSPKQNGGTVAGDYASHGIVLTLANMDRIQGAAEWLRRLGDPDAGVPPSVFVSRRCARLIECMPSLEHNPYRAEDVLKVDTDEDGVGGDDPYDASRYGLMVATGVRAGYGESPLAGWRG